MAWVAAEDQTAVVVAALAITVVGVAVFAAGSTEILQG